MLLSLYLSIANSSLHGNTLTLPQSFFLSPVAAVAAASAVPVYFVPVWTERTLFYITHMRDKSKAFLLNSPTSAAMYKLLGVREVSPIRLLCDRAQGVVAAAAIGRSTRRTEEDFSFRESAAVEGFFRGTAELSFRHELKRRQFLP